jgi:predicted glycogen debranching enzyme
VTLPTDFTSLAALEWLETNGLGGYASGTAAGAGTRGYHGLLAAALRSPAERLLMITTCDEWTVEKTPVYLSSHQYPGAVSPDGFTHLESFTTDPFPAWIYRAGARRIERRVFMVRGENTTVVRYRLLEGTLVKLAVRPMFVFRDHHARRVASDAWRVVATRSGSAVHCAPTDGGHPLSVQIGGAAYRDEPQWFKRFEYLRELERGLEFREDAYAPFVVELPLAPDVWTDLVFSAELRAPRAADALEAAELKRRRAITKIQPVDDPFSQRLAAACDAFIVQRPPAGRSVIAGYPWFGDWGRDAMISLPGLALSTARLDDAARILTTFAASMRDGLLPNRFSDTGVEPEYNTVDASLWFAVALHQFRAAGGDAALVDSALGDALERIVLAYAQGTLFGIREDADGLVTQGADGVALTWMDARVNGRVITPRRGKAVEINALWYNARRVLGDIQSRRGKKRDAAKTRRLAERTRESFLTTFWDESSGSFYDVIRPDGTRDASIRPNQLFAASLPYPVIARAQAARMVKIVAQHLLTPCGLRTLAPSDPAYQARCEGGPEQRDGAYHQGTVWPWLLGAFVDASLYGERDTAATRARLQALITPMKDHLDEACMGQISEIFDGDAPHAPRGCPAQAWSAAEVLRAWRRLNAAKPRASNTAERAAAKVPS